MATGCMMIFLLTLIVLVMHIIRGDNAKDLKYNTQNNGGNYDDQPSSPLCYNHSQHHDDGP